MLLAREGRTMSCKQRRQIAAAASDCSNFFVRRFMSQEFTVAEMRRQQGNSCALPWDLPATGQGFPAWHQLCLPESLADSWLHTHVIRVWGTKRLSQALFMSCFWLCYAFRKKAYSYSPFSCFWKGIYIFLPGINWIGILAILCSL